MSLATILDSLSVESIQEKDPAVTTTGPAVPAIQAIGSELPRRDDTPLDDGTLESVMDGVGELMDMGKKLSTEARHSELAMRGFAIQLEHLSKQPHMDFIPAHLTEYVTREGISSAIKNALDRIIAWIREHYNKLREYVARGARSKRAADTTNKVKSMVKELDTVKETLKKDTSGTSTKAITIDLSNHYEIQRVLGVLGRYLSKLEPCKDDDELVAAVTKHVRHVTDLYKSNLSAHLLPVIADIVANHNNETSMEVVFDKIVNVLKDTSIYKGSHFSLDSQRNIETSLVSINTYVSFDSNTNTIRYSKIDHSGRFYNIKDNTFTVKDPLTFVERIRECMKPIAEIDFDAILKKTVSELKIIDNGLVTHIANEAASAEPNKHMIDIFKHINNMITDIYEHGYIPTAIDDMFTFIMAQANLVDLLGLTPKDIS